MKQKALSLEFILILSLILSLLFIPYRIKAKDYESFPVVDNQVIVNGTEVLEISDGEYILDNSLSIEDGATLIVRDATLIFESSSRTIIECSENSTILFEKSTIYHKKGYSYLHFYDNTNVTVLDSLLSTAYFYLYDSSKAMIENSVLTYTTYLYDSAQISIEISTLSSLSIRDSSSAKIVDSSIFYDLNLYFKQDSDLSINSFNKGRIDSWSLYEDNDVTKAYIDLEIKNSEINELDIEIRDTSKIRIFNSRLDRVYNYNNAELELEDSTVRYLYVYDSSNVVVEDTIINGIYLEFEQDSDLVLSGLNPGVISFWSIANNCIVYKKYVSLELTDCEVDYWYIYAYDTSKIEIRDSVLNYVYGYGTSGVSVYRSELQGIYGYGDARIEIQDSNLRYLGAYDSSNLIITDSDVTQTLNLEFESDSNIQGILPSGLVEDWNLNRDLIVATVYIDVSIKDSEINQWQINLYGESNVVLANSDIYYAYAYAESNLTLKDSAVRYLYVYDSSNVVVEDTIINGIYLEFEQDSDLVLSGLNPGVISFWSIANNCIVYKKYVSLELTDCEVDYWHLYARGTSTISIEESNVNRIYGYDESMVSIIGSLFGSVYSYTTSNILLDDSTVNSLGVYDSSRMNVEDSMIENRITLEFESASKIIGVLPNEDVSLWSLNSIADVAQIDLRLENVEMNGKWSLNCYGTSEIKISNSILDSISVNEASVVDIEKSNIRYAYSYGDSKLNISDSENCQNVYGYDISEIQVCNTAISRTRGYDFSIIHLLNSSSGSLEVYDGSIFKVGWYLIFTAKDADSGVLSNVNVEVFDDNNNKLLEESTGSDGTLDLFLWEKTIYSERTDYLGNYLLKIERDGLDDELILKPPKSSVEIYFVYKGGTADPATNIFNQGYTSIIIIVVLIAIIVFLLLTRRRNT